MYLSSDKYATTNYNIRVYIYVYACMYICNTGVTA